MATMNIDKTVKNNLCIGCGLCSVVCPETVISMVWNKRLTWQPIVSESGCTSCGRCLNVCPQSPQCIVEYAAAAQAQGVRFGLLPNASYFIAYDSDKTRRIRSASGGVTTLLLQHLLDSGAVDGVIGSQPIVGKAGEPHFEMRIFRSAEALEQGRSSHYHPLSYDKVLREVQNSNGSFALVGVPCVLRGIERLHKELRNKIKYKIALICGKNVTGAFTDCLAEKEGIGKNALWRVNLRDKIGIADANNFNNYFELPERVIRRSRFETAFTMMWRNYFFAQECCLYCADFYGIDADISIKDAWGRQSSDPLGTSVIVVNNQEITEHLTHLKFSGRLYLEACDSDEVFNSQTVTPIFKHEKVRDRLVWKRSLHEKLVAFSLCSRRHWLSRDSHEYWRLWLLIKLSNFVYFKFGKVPVLFLVSLVAPLKMEFTTLSNLIRMLVPTRLLRKIRKELIG